MFESVENITFNGIDLASAFTDESRGVYFVVNDVRGRGVLGVENTLINVGGMDGAHPSSTRTPVRYLDVDITLKGESFEDLRKRIERLNDILYTGNESVPITFADESDRTYYGKLDDVSYRIELSKIYQATLTFVCADPYSYGEEQPYQFVDDTAIIENPGKAEAKPIFELEVLQDTTFAMVQNGEDEYMAIGRPYEEDEVPTSDREVTLDDDATSLIGWSALPGGSTLYNLGIVGGEMWSNGYAFEPRTYGENPNGWVGPAIKRSLSEELQDFELEIDIAMLNGRNGVGQTRILGLDAEDRLIFSMGMVDGTASRPDNRALFGLGEGNATWFAYKGDHGINVWNDGRFMLRIRRRGEKIEAWIARKLDPLGRQLTGRHYRSYDDREGRHQRKLAQVVIYMAKARSYPTFFMYMHHMTVTKLINLADYEVPYIARVGDIITFDHTNEGDILINGEPRNDLKDFGGSFFTLKKGHNQLTTFPFETFNTKLRFRPRYR